jgi:hypothetical protein
MPDSRFEHWGEDVARAHGMEYLREVPSVVLGGRVLVHNRVRPVARRSGIRGSRFWLQQPDERLERCDCGWAPELAEHYRVARPFTPPG